MMEGLFELITAHQAYAHWIIFGSILLAGFNIPISIDLMMALTALLASHVIPQYAPHLFAAIILGCIFSAWIAYWLGRLVGHRLLEIKWFQKMLPQARLEKITAYSQKNGFLTLLVGRFIPFGVRNGIFMTAGLTRFSFAKFALYDGIACSIWGTLFFSLFYSVGKNFEYLSHFVKIINIAVFTLFAVGLISYLWRKKVRARREQAALCDRTKKD